MILADFPLRARRNQTRYGCGKSGKNLALERAVELAQCPIQRGQNLRSQLAHAAGAQGEDHVALASYGDRSRSITRARQLSNSAKRRRK